MNQKTCKNAIEALLFASGDPVTPEKLAEAIGAELHMVEKLLVELRDEYDVKDRGMCLLRLEDRWQMASRPQYGELVKRLMDNRRNAQPRCAGGAGDHCLQPAGIARLY